MPLRRDGQPRESPSLADQCQILIDNRVDMMYEVIESVVLDYPLPWSELDCDVGEPVLVDIALSDPAQEEWILYYDRHLRNTTVLRSDGVTVNYHVRTIHQASYTTSYHAIIGTSCCSFNYKRWIPKSSTHFCLLQGPSSQAAQAFGNRVQHLGVIRPVHVPPMEPRWPHTNPHVCVKAEDSMHALIAEALPQLPNATVTVFARELPSVYTAHPQVTLSSTLHFLQHHSRVASCDLIVVSDLPKVRCSAHTLGANLDVALAQAESYQIPVLLSRSVDVTGYNLSGAVVESSLDIVDQVRSVASRIETTVRGGYLWEEDEIVEDPRPVLNLVEANSPCRIVVENKVDYHYEILESVAMRYPLPWEALGCDGKLVVVDFALTTKKGSDFKGEGVSWEDYYLKSVRGQQRIREDGVRVEFGDLVDHRLYQQPYAAVVDASCDFDQVLPWDERHPNTFCVFHKTPTRYMFPREQLGRACWLSPLHSSCYFIPTDLPEFPKARQSQKATLCVSGKNRHHGLLAAALRLTGLENVELKIYGRWIDKEKPGLSAYTNLSSWEHIQEPSFVDFQRHMASCDVILPMIDPQHNPEYFVREKMLSGAVSQAIAYRIPIVLQHELADIYDGHWTARTYSYDDVGGLAKGLTRAVVDWEGMRAS